MDDLLKRRMIGKDVVIPILLWVGIIFVFLNVKNIPYDLTAQQNIVLRYFVKVVMTTLHLVISE